MARAPHFLRPLLDAAPAGLVLRNTRTGRRCWPARCCRRSNRDARKTGLLKHTSLDDGEAMIIAPSTPFTPGS